jgi:hypothetical protein
MKYFDTLLRILVGFIILSCNRSSHNAEITYGVSFEQSIANFDTPSYLIPINNFISEENEASKNSFFFEDIKSRQMLKCNIFEDSIHLTEIANVDSTIWPINKLHKSTDLFYCYNHNTNRLSYQITQGAALQAYQLDQQYGLINLLSGYEKNGTSSILLDNASKTIGFGTTKERLEYYQKVKPLLMIDILPEGINHKAFGIWPKEYVATGNGYDDPYAKACFGHNNHVCVSFGADHNLYLYNDTALIYSKNNKSNYINNFKAYPDEKQFDMSYLREYTQSEPKYTNLIFDPWKKMYYRTVKHSFLNATTGYEVKSFWSVIITDDELNIIGECKFDYQYDPNVFIPTPFGILLMKGNLPDPKERTLTLIKLSIYE